MPRKKDTVMTDEAQEVQGKTRKTGEQTKVGELMLPEWRSELKYTIPIEGIREEMKAQALKEPVIYEEFVFPQVSNEEQANAVMRAKEWSLIDEVNAKLTGAARSSCYQATSALYKESKVTANQIAERAIKDLKRLGFSEDEARGMIDSRPVAVND